MTTTYTQIVKQIENLRAEAEKLRAKEVSEVVLRIREAIDAYDLSPEDLGFGAVAAANTGRSAGPTGRRKIYTDVKFQDAAGNVWGGRGPRPRWLRDALDAGRSLQEFEVKA